jgi:hypothetical protein
VATGCRSLPRRSAPVGPGADSRLHAHIRTPLPARWRGSGPPVRPRVAPRHVHDDGTDLSILDRPPGLRLADVGPHWPTPDTFMFRKFEDIQHGSTFILGRTGPLVHGSMSWATYLSGVGAFLIGWLTVLLLFGLLVAWGSVRYSIRKTSAPHRTWRVLSWTPGIALIFVSTIFLWVNHLDQQPVGRIIMRSGHPVVLMSIAHPTLARLLGDVNLTLGLGLWIGAAVSLTYLASHVEVDARDSWLPITISRFVGRAMPLFLIAYGLWIVGLRSQKPPAVPGQVVVSYVHSGWWPLAIAALVLTTVISLRGAAALTTIHRQSSTISVPVSSD